MDQYYVSSLPSQQATTDDETQVRRAMISTYALQPTALIAHRSSSRRPQRNYLDLLPRWSVGSNPFDCPENGNNPLQQVDRYEW